MTKGRTSVERIKEMVVDAVLCKNKFRVHKNSAGEKFIIINDSGVEFGKSYFNLIGDLGYHLEENPGVLMTEKANVDSVYVYSGVKKERHYRAWSKLIAEIMKFDDYELREEAVNRLVGVSKVLDVKIVLFDLIRCTTMISVEPEEYAKHSDVYDETNKTVVAYERALADNKYGGCLYCLRRNLPHKKEKPSKVVHIK